MAVEPAQPAVFGVLHASSLGRRVVVIAEEVEDAVQRVAGDFAGPGGAELARLEQGNGDADEDFAVQVRGGLRLAVVERKDVGGAGLAEVVEMQSVHFGDADQVDPELVLVLAEAGFEELPQQMAEVREVEPLDALSVGEDEGEGWWLSGGLGVLRRHG
jgi:hypothetical protein